jgi:hypothetical protein
VKSITELENGMATYPVHIDGVPAHLPWKTIATLPVGTFLENIAVRANGTLLVSSMLHGEIFFLDPNAEDPHSTLKKVHTFVTESTFVEDEGARDYGSGTLSEAIVEDPRNNDQFYTFSGKHGKTGSWAVFKIDMHLFERDGKVIVDKVADVPWALWLNGATFIPGTSKLVVADSLQGQLISCDVDSGDVKVWLEDPLLAKITDRPPWPGVNGVQCYRGHIFLTSSDRALLVRAQISTSTGEYTQNSLKVMAEGVAGDDLAFDVGGNAYVTTNPQQTVLMFPRIGLNDAEMTAERFIVAGGWESAETAGPTAVAFGRTEKDNSSIYVVTTGGLINPVGAGPGPARVFRVDVGVKGEV